MEEPNRQLSDVRELPLVVYEHNLKVREAYKSVLFLLPTQPIFGSIILIIIMSLVKGLRFSPKRQACYAICFVTESRWDAKRFLKAKPETICTIYENPYFSE